MDVDAHPRQVIALLHESSKVVVLLTDGLERLAVGTVDKQRVMAVEVVHVV